MRIFINQKEPADNKYKTKFFQMAALFAEEYNKYVPEDAPEEDKARIVIPYSFLITKVKLLFPECLDAVQPGQEERKFVTAVRGKRDLFEFVLTEEDKTLYRQLHWRAAALVRENVTFQEEPVAAAKEAHEHHVGVLDEVSVQGVRSKANDINTTLELTGHIAQNWFGDRKIGRDSDFPALRPASDAGTTVGGVGLFLAMLQREETRKLLRAPIGKLPPMVEENAPLYRDLFGRAADLVRRINDDTLTRQTMDTQHKHVEKMRGRKEKPVISRGQVGVILNDAKRYGKALADLTPEWLVERGICSEGQAVAYQGVSGAALLQAIVANRDARNEMKIEPLVDETVDRAFTQLVMGPGLKKGTTLYAVDDREFFEKVTGVNREAQIIDGQTTMQVTRANELTKPDKDNIIKLDVIKSGMLYANMHARLSELKKGHPERDESINKTLAAMHETIQAHGHSNGSTKHPPLEEEMRATELPGFTARLEKRDPAVHGQAVSDIEQLLAKHNGSLNGEVVDALSRAARKARSLTTRQYMPSTNGNGKSAQDL